MPENELIARAIKLAEQILSEVIRPRLPTSCTIVDYVVLQSGALDASIHD